MKKALVIVVLMLLFISALAQAPESFNYQAVVRDESNNPITDQAVSFKMSILKESIIGDAVYSELHSTTTNSIGLVNLVIGNGTDKVSDISSIDWGADSYFLKVEIDKTGGTAYVEMGTTQLLSVPYAMYSQTASIVKMRTSMFGDTLFLGLQQYVIIPGISLANPHYSSSEPITDIDGNIYATVKIGNQVWMAENLKTTKYKNGDLIGTTTPAALDIYGESMPKYQWAYDGNEDNVATYGRLYTWYTITDSRGVCPTGWHVPTDGEWTELTNYLSGESVAGGKLKESGTIHWASPNTGANNESGFTALPGGSRTAAGVFNYIGSLGFWWSATEEYTDYAWYRIMYYNGSNVYRDYDYGSKDGFSVRCIKDE